MSTAETRLGQPRDWDESKPYPKCWDGMEDHREKGRKLRRKQWPNLKCLSCGHCHLDYSGWPWCEEPGERLPWRSWKERPVDMRGRDRPWPRWCGMADIFDAEDGIASQRRPRLLRRIYAMIHHLAVMAASVFDRR